jgi:dyslexia susceptibility 1 candidate gene 1 protein
MPVYVKDFSWHESDSSVFLSVPLKGVQPRSTDVFATDEYLKIGFGPFIFEAFLPATVDGIVCRTFQSILSQLCYTVINFFQ